MTGIGPCRAALRLSARRAAWVATLLAAPGCPRDDEGGKPSGGDTGPDTAGDTDTGEPVADCDFGEVQHECSARVDLDGDGAIDSACTEVDADQLFAPPIDTADPDRNTEFGYGLGTLPDIDGDGIEELVIGEPYERSDSDPDYEAVEWHGFYAPLIDHIYFSTQLCTTGATLAYGGAGTIVRSSDDIELGDTCHGYVDCTYPISPASLLHSIGDLDGDGLVEVAMPDYDAALGGVMNVHSAATLLEGGHVPHTDAVGRITHEEGFLYLTADAGDPDDDGVGDFFLQAHEATFLCAGSLVVGGRSATAGECATSFGQGAPLVNGPVDLNADGVDDIVFGPPYGGTGLYVWWGGAELRSGVAEGTEDLVVEGLGSGWGLKQVPEPKVWVMEDVDEDGLPELLGAAGSGGYPSVLLGAQLVPGVSMEDDVWFRIWEDYEELGGTVGGNIVLWAEVYWSDTVEQFVFPASQVRAGGSVYRVLEAVDPVLKVTGSVDNNSLSTLIADFDGDAELDLAFVPASRSQARGLYLAP